MTTEKLTFETQRFKTTVEQTAFTELLESLDHVRPIFITREKFNEKKGNFLVEVGEDQFGKQYELFLPQDITVFEFPAIIKRINSVTFGEILPDYASVVELKYKIELICDELVKRLGKNTQEKELLGFFRLQKKISLYKEKKNIQKALKNYYKLYKDLGGTVDEFAGNNRRLIPEKYQEEHYNNYFKQYKKEFEKIKTITSLNMFLSTLEYSTASDISLHLDETFLEKGENMLRYGFMTLTQREFDNIKEKKEELDRKEEKGEKEIRVSEVNEKILSEKEELLRKRINIDRYKKLLNNAREQNDIGEINRLEIEVTRLILKTLNSMYPYQRTESDDGYQPSKIMESKELYCVGFSIVGHGFLSELGINHNALCIPGHSALEVLIGGERYYFDADLSGELGFLRWGAASGVYKSYEVKDEKGEVVYENRGIAGNAERVLLSQISNNKGISFLNKGLLLNAKGMKGDAREKFQLSEKMFSNAKIYFPHHAGAFYNIGLSYWNLKNYSKAIENILDSNGIDPQKIMYYEKLSLLLLNGGYSQELSELYMYTSKIFVSGGQEGSSSSVHKKKILKLYKKGDIQNIQIFLEEMYDTEKKKKDLIKNYENETIRLFNKGDYEGVLDKTALLLEQDPNNKDAHWRLGISFSRLGKDMEALLAFKRLLEIGTIDLVLHKNLAITLENLGKKEESKLFLFIMSLVGSKDELLVGVDFSKGSQDFLDKKSEIMKLYTESGNSLSEVNKYLLKL